MGKGRKAKKGLKAKGAKKKSGWKLLRNKFRPLDYCNEIKKKSGWKLLKSKVRPLKKKKRVAKKKMGAVVKLKKGAKTAKKRRARARLVKTPDIALEIARKILLETYARRSPRKSLAEMQETANPSDGTSFAPSEPDTAPAPLAPLASAPSIAAKLSYDEAWAEFRSV